MAAAILLIAGIFALRDGLARRSRLLRPEALLLKADNLAHLKGREEDIDRLSALCYEYQQVNLVGESGAGKSALIQAGLCPRLKAEQGLFPIYLNVWGQDWEAGPHTALVLALWEALSNEDRRTLGFAEPPKPEHLVSMLEHVRAKLGRTPLLIFDQFDDYQTRHRSQFLAGRRRTWLPANRLITANSFWRNIKEVIDNHTVHCLFATRTDTADGLESIRFTSPQVYPLDRLNVDFVLPLLTELTANVEGKDPVVFAPDRGWERLKGRLARDLSQDGAVLPVQMKIALQGLASLRSLTVGDYERAGGVDGLQAAHVERHVASTAIHSGLTKMQLRTLLISLADAETLKTMPRSTADLEKVIIAGYEMDTDRIERAVEAALLGGSCNDLEMKEIIRKRLDPDSRQHVWILDHDYLCRGVLEAERRSNRWFALAQEGYRAFQDASGSAWRTWRSLLSPWQQIMLAAQCVRGRFRYGSLRSYAAWSLCRLVPYLLMLTAVVYGGIEIRQRQQAAYDHTKAARLRAAIGLYEELSPIELDALWELAESNNAVRDSFLAQALEHPATAEQFYRRAHMAIQAAIGLDPDRREKVFHEVVSPCLRHPPILFSKKDACVRIGIALSIEDRYPEFALFTVKILIEVIGKTTDPWRLEMLAADLKASAANLAIADAQRVFTQLLAALDKTTNPQQLAWLAPALAAAANLAPADAQRAFTQLLAALDKTTNPQQLAALPEALKAVPGTLDPQQLINQLKWPVSVGGLRSTLLDMLEKQTGQMFNGNIWKMVEWAQKQALDVKSPPKRSDKR